MKKGVEKKILSKEKNKNVGLIDILLKPIWDAAIFRHAINMAITICDNFNLFNLRAPFDFDTPKSKILKINFYSKKIFTFYSMNKIFIFYVKSFDTN